MGELKKMILVIVVILAAVGFFYLKLSNVNTSASQIEQIKKASTSQKKIKSDKQTIKKETNMKEQNKKEIYLAGGCFWGVEEYFSRVDGYKVLLRGMNKFGA